MELELYIPRVHQAVEEHGSSRLKQDIEEGPETNVWTDAELYMARSILTYDSELEELSREKRRELCRLYSERYR